MSALAQILEDMLAEAKAKGHARRKLKNGMFIEIQIVIHNVKVILSRAKVYPSIQEWDTVMKYFPYNTPKVVPVPGNHGGRMSIMGTVPTQRVMQLKFG